MVIGEALRQFDAGSEFAQAVLEAFRRRDSAKGTDIGVGQAAKGKLFPAVNVLQIERLVGALNDFGGAIVAPDPRDQLVVRLARALGNEDVTGPAQIPRRLAQGPPREEELVSKRGLPIDQNDVEPMLEMEILQSVVEQEGVGFHLA